MAREPQPGGYLWNTAQDIGEAAYQESTKAAADIGNTYQAVLYGGWSPQAAHNASMRGASNRLMEETAIAENAKSIEPLPEITKDAPAKE